jgi:hypothetical protein
VRARRARRAAFLIAIVVRVIRRVGRDAWSLLSRVRNVAPATYVVARDIVSGSREDACWELSTSAVHAVLARHPRLGFKRSFVSAMCAQAAQPDGTRTHFLVRYMQSGARIKRTSLRQSSPSRSSRGASSSVSTARSGASSAMPRSFPPAPDNGPAAMSSGKRDRFQSSCPAPLSCSDEHLGITGRRSHKRADCRRRVDVLQVAHDERWHQRAPAARKRVVTACGSRGEHSDH